MEDKEERYGDSKKMGRIIPAYILACTLFSFSILKRKILEGDLDDGRKGKYSTYTG